MMMKLSQQVEKFWKTDFVDLVSSSKVSMSVEDERAFCIMEGSSKKVSGHYQLDRKSTRLNSSHTDLSRMPSSA